MTSDRIYANKDSACSNDLSKLLNLLLKMVHLFRASLISDTAEYYIANCYKETCRILSTQSHMRWIFQTLAQFSTACSSKRLADNLSLFSV
jgi:hypothetical protein